MIDIDYIREIRERVPAAALYEQLAEECVELAHAALKMARHMRNENPTPMTEEQIKHNLIEEASDIHLVSRILDIKPDVQVVDTKLVRWYDRLMDAEREARE
jgi:hypothetical protein